MTRSTAEALDRAAADAVVSALAAVGLSVTLLGPGGGVDLVVQVDDRDVPLRLKAASYVTPDRVSTIVAGPAGEMTRLLVADHITEIAREELAAAGWSWLDRRGHLYLRAPGVLIDRTIAPLPRTATPAAVAPIAGAAGVAVGYASLLDPTRVLPVRASAGALGFSPSSISTARTALRESGLVERNWLPIVPELFWALADAWKPAATGLVKRPKPGDAHTRATDLDAPGWCLTGTAAAAAWGAPVVTTDPLLELYLPEPLMVTIAERTYQRSRDLGDAAASVAVAPTRVVTAQRHAPPRRGGWPLAHPLAVALDLAQDRARGREILDDWTPPEAFHRVW